MTNVEEEPIPDSSTDSELSRPTRPLREKFSAWPDRTRALAILAGMVAIVGIPILTIRLWKTIPSVYSSIKEKIQNPFVNVIRQLPWVGGRILREWRDKGDD